ncbi:hypothetical protein [uncultured Draconibacterium sp.]|uniref:hypothetical protein n=1 Tax=uncultured Draconibacterium sp. TaxID=1573823 RepID=UPI0029C64F45|nr:hypothetical protein [uncultured Draconibacterium sp.]
MKKIKFILGLIFLIGVISCDKEKNDNQNIQISTNKVSYSSSESVYLEISNHYDTELSYYICSSYDGIPPSIWILKDDEWTGFWGPICDGFQSHCCGALEPQTEYKDTLDITFEKGTYKIEYSFIVEHGEGYQSFYSNEFTVD